MKIFGLVEVILQSYGGILSGGVAEVPIVSKNLFKHIKRFGKKNSVGLEAVPNCELEIPEFNYSYKNRKVYTVLQNFFEKRGNAVYFLEDLEYHRKMAEVGSKIVELQEKLEKNTNENEVTEMEEELKRLEAEFNYIYFVGREEPILQAIAKHKVDLVFLGAAHAARFFRRAKELRKKPYSIRIDAYWEEQLIKAPDRNYIAFLLDTSSDPDDSYEPLDPKQAAEILKGRWVFRPERIKDPNNTHYSGLVEQYERPINPRKNNFTS